jgi:hypothetical protein
MNIKGCSKVQSHDNSTEGAKVLQQSRWNPPCVLILQTHLWLHVYGFVPEAEAFAMSIPNINLALSIPNINPRPGN